MNSATLHSLQVLPRGPSGWGTPVLQFGKVTTILLGPNGSGKTPLIKLLSYALGHPVELPPAVRANCSEVILTLSHDGQVAHVRREIVDGFSVVATEDGLGPRLFEGERTYTTWLIERLGLPPRVLANKQGTDAVAPYMSVIAPMFAVDQDAGWQELYVPLSTHQFIKDQREEIMRWFLDVPARNRAVDKKAFEEAKAHQASLREQIAFKRRALEALRRELHNDQTPQAVEQLNRRRTTLLEELARSTSLLDTLSRSESALDVRLRQATEQREQLRFHLNSAQRRRDELMQVSSEVTTELHALEQNEVAAEAFRTLCGSDACQFFRRPEESYGRRVLYLRDQLKDFESSANQIDTELALLRDRLVAADAATKEAMAAKRQSLVGGSGDNIVNTVDALSQELSDVNVRLDRLSRLNREQAQLEALINKEIRATEEVAALRPVGQGRRENARLLDARSLLASTFKEWLVALRTPNLAAADVSFDEQLRLIIDGERFSLTSSHSGSTRTRIVLALHAAMVATSVTMAGSHPRMLILDAPRQHELSADDIRSFVAQFYVMSSALSAPIQLVLSATDGQVASQEHVDQLWEPGFLFGDKPRFLGPLPPARGRE